MALLRLFLSVVYDCKWDYFRRTLLFLSLCCGIIASQSECMITFDISVSTPIDIPSCNLSGSSQIWRPISVLPRVAGQLVSLILAGPLISHCIQFRHNLDDSSGAWYGGYRNFRIRRDCNVFPNSEVQFLCSGWSFALLSMSESFFNLANGSNRGFYFEIKATGWPLIEPILLLIDNITLKNLSMN